MKKFISFAFAALMVVAIASCGSKNTENTDTTAVETPAVEQVDSNATVTSDEKALVEDPVCSEEAPVETAQ